MNQDATQNKQIQVGRKIATLVYALYDVSLLLGITGIVGAIVAYMKKDDFSETWLASHFRWQIRTFLFGLLWGVFGVLTFFLVVGWVILLTTAIWFIYRIVKGWLQLVEEKPMYSEISGSDKGTRVLFISAALAVCVAILVGGGVYYQKRQAEEILVGEMLQRHQRLMKNLEQDDEGDPPAEMAENPVHLPLEAMNVKLAPDGSRTLEINITLELTDEEALEAVGLSSYSA